MSAVNRIPIRIRLVGVFALLMTLVLAGTGVVIYSRTAADLDSQIARELDARLAGVVAIVNDDGDDLGDPRQDPLRRVDPRAFVQVLSPTGSIAGGTPELLANSRILSDELVLELLSGEIKSIDIRLPGEAGSIRVVADSTVDDNVRYTVLVGASLADREETLAGLGRLLLIGFPLALLVACAAGYWIASAALAPVTRMSREAAAISASDSVRSLSVPAADDEIRRLAEDLNLMLGRLGAALERERRFVADASHELRTPLSVMTTELELALTGERDAAEMHAALTSAATETSRLVRLAEDLLILARTEDGRLPVHPEPVELLPLVQAVAGRMQAKAGPDRRIEVDVPADLVLKVDPLRLEQALANLVANAIDHGAGTVTVEAARSLPGSNTTEIRVLDEGPGVDAAIAGAEFDRFTRGGDARRLPGSGLGLAIVAAVTAGHGGETGIERRPDGRTCAWLRLP